MPRYESDGSHRKCAVFALALVAIGGGSLPVVAQTPAAVGALVSVESFSLVVARLDKAVAFYRNVLGLELSNSPGAFDKSRMNLGNTPGAQSRVASLRVPGSALVVELLEYKGIDRKPVRPNFQDPGAATLVVFVRDIDGVIAKLKKAGGRIISTDGQIVTTTFPTSTARVIFAQDPDGFFIGISQREPLPKNTAPASSNVIGASLELMVGDMDQTLRVYRDVLGLDYPPSAFSLREGINRGGGTPGAEVRRTQAVMPGTVADALYDKMIFLEYKHVPRNPLHTRIQDPGTPILRLNVRDLDATSKALKAAGVEVISRNGEPVTVNGNSRMLIVRDLNNMYLELVQRSANEH